MVYGFSVWKCDSMRWNSSEASYWLPTLTLPPSYTTKRAPPALCWSLSPLCLFTPHLHPLKLNSHKPLSHSVRRLCIFLFHFHAGRRCLSRAVFPMHMRCGLCCLPDTGALCSLGARQDYQKTITLIVIRLLRLSQDFLYQCRIKCLLIGLCLLSFSEPLQEQLFVYFKAFLTCSTKFIRKHAN